MTSHTGSDRARRTAIRLLRWYPRPWRVRYEREMQALLEDMPVGWTQVANLAGTAAREWMSPRAIGWPSRSAAGRLQRVRLYKFIAFAFLVDGIARIIAAQIVNAQFVVSDELQRNISLVFLFLPFARVAWCLLFLLKRVQRSRLGALADRHLWIKHLSDWEVVAWTVWYLPPMVMRHALPIPAHYGDFLRTMKPFENAYLVWLSTYVLWQVSARTSRIRKVHTAFLNRRKVWPPKVAPL